MLLAELSDNAIVGIIFGVLSVVGAAAGSYGAMKWGLATLTAKVDGMNEWLKKVAAGDRKVDGEMQTTLDEHGRMLAKHDERISHLEIEHAARTAKHCSP